MEQFLQFATHHYALVGGAVLVLLLVAINEQRLRTASFGSIAPADAVRLMNGGAILIDVRGSEDFKAGHIGGARHLPGATIADGASALERFKEKAIIAYCNDGMTAGAAARHLGRLGFKQAYNLRGGLVAWRADNLPLVKG
jgi:rhodanese-related sulfurtransferase